MKRLILTLIVGLGSLTYQAKAQWAVIDPSNLAQNILTVSKTATTATNVINSFKEMQKIYDQGKEYYDGLRQVQNIIKDARKVQETVAMISEISDIYVKNYNKMLTDQNYTVEELAAIGLGYSKLMQGSGNLLSDIKTIITSSNGLSMSDKERMEMIDKIHSEMRDYRNLTQYYTNKTIAVSYLRAKRKKETDRIMGLYGTPSERYW